MTNNEIYQFVEQMAKLIDLPIAPEYLPGVVANMTRIAEIAQQVNEFPIAAEIEAATVFQP